MGSLDGGRILADHGVRPARSERSAHHVTSGAVSHMRICGHRPARPALRMPIRYAYIRS